MKLLPMEYIFILFRLGSWLDIEHNFIRYTKIISCSIKLMAKIDTKLVRSSRRHVIPPTLNSLPTPRKEANSLTCLLPETPSFIRINTECILANDLVQCSLFISYGGLWQALEWQAMLQETVLQLLHCDTCLDSCLLGCLVYKGDLWHLVQVYGDIWMDGPLVLLALATILIGYYV